jgi:hypothetical protein
MSMTDEPPTDDPLIIDSGPVLLAATTGPQVEPQEVREVDDGSGSPDAGE